MNSKMAGTLSLKTMVSDQLERAREKIASAKVQPKSAEVTKVASAQVSPTDLSEIEKLASAFDEAAELLTKEAADAVDNGHESKQGGTQLPVAKATPGEQPAKKDGSKKHSPPMRVGAQTASDNGSSKTHMPVDDKKAPGGPAYPKEGVLKTAMEIPAGGVARDAEASASGVGKGKMGLMAEKAKVQLDKAVGLAKAHPVKAGLGAAGVGLAGLGAAKLMSKDKKSSASLEYILGLTKEAEAAQGGMTLASKSGEGPKPPSDAAGGNDARKAIKSNEAVTAMKKVDGKVPQKRMLSEVLTEPAMSAKTDKTVSQNLRNASKGGVKIAAAKALLTKIASDKSDPRHEQLMKAVQNKRS